MKEGNGHFLCSNEINAFYIPQCGFSLLNIDICLTIAYILTKKGGRHDSFTHSLTQSINQSILGALFIVVLLFLTSLAQDSFDDWYCSVPGDSSYIYNENQQGGKFLTSTGNLHVLIVFVEFPDDSFQISYPLWPKTQPASAPTFINTFIDQTPSVNSTNGNLTHYFREMSDGNFILTGSVYHMVTRYTRQEYINQGKKRADINKEILMRLDSLISFASFDNWKKVSDYSHVQEPDGFVDMVFMIYRNVGEEDPRNCDSTSSTKKLLDFCYGGQTKLGFNVITVDDGARKINGFYGATIVYGALRGAGGAWSLEVPPNRVFAHELAHYWFPFTNNYHNGGGFWAILNNWGRRLLKSSNGFSPVNSWEREALDWHEPVFLPYGSGNFENLVLTDFITTNKSYKLQLPSSNPKEYLRLEYHAKKSMFDVTDESDNSVQGLYVLHQFIKFFPDTEFVLIPSDGRWKWKTEEIYCSPSSNWKVLVFEYDSLDAVNGFYDSQIVSCTCPTTPQCAACCVGCNDKNKVKCPSWIHAYRDRLTGELMLWPKFRGDGKDAYTPTLNNVISTWSNPGVVTSKKQKVYLSIEIISQQNDSLIFNVYMDSAFAILSPPGKIQDLVLVSSANNHPLLKWSPNKEPDFAYYEVWKKKNNINFFLFDTTSNPFYEDVTEQIVTGPTQSNEQVAEYKVRAVDVQQKKSSFSDVVNTRVKGRPLFKFANMDTSINKELFSLKCYPNPANSRFVIEFAIPFSGKVKGVIYNALGQVVTNLFDGFYGEGSHTFFWEGVTSTGNTVSSGYYWVAITWNKKTIVQPILLLR